MPVGHGERNFMGCSAAASPILNGHPCAPPPPLPPIPAAPERPDRCAAFPVATQKKPRLRGVSVACLCVEECRSRCYPVMRYPASKLASSRSAILRISLGAFNPSRPWSVDAYRKSNTRANCPLHPVRRPGGLSNVTQCTLYASSRGFETVRTRQGCGYVGILDR